MAASIEKLMKSASQKLEKAGIEEPALVARVLLEHVMQTSSHGLRGREEEKISSDKAALYNQLIERRLAHEPVSRIKGRREFWSMDFLLSPDTLDPRPDTETMVEEILRLTPDKKAPLKLLDLGAGTGCILLALLKELPNAFGVGVDISFGAAQTANRNAELLGLKNRAAFMVGNWANAIGGQFDIITSNPPYIAELEAVNLAPEVKLFDPPTALFGGPTGLDAYQALLPDIPGLLKPGGILALESAPSQIIAIQKLAREQNLAFNHSAKDLAGYERCLIFHKAG
ncbi:MAG: peptide chain release factor N(5)-glutamine methyltransferase [Dongiaceae bacterium]